MSPKTEKYILIYMEDLHLSHFDGFQDNSAAETLRDLIHYKRWFSSKKQSMRKIQKVNVVSCVNPAFTSPSKLSKRLLRQFSVVGLEMMDSDGMFQVVNRLLDIHAANWPSDMTSKVPQVSRAIIDLYTHCTEYMKPTPIKVQYTFN